MDGKQTQVVSADRLFPYVERAVDRFTLPAAPGLSDNDVTREDEEADVLEATDPPEQSRGEIEEVLEQRGQSGATSTSRPTRQRKPPPRWGDYVLREEMDAVVRVINEEPPRTDKIVGSPFVPQHSVALQPELTEQKTNRNERIAALINEKTPEEELIRVLKACSEEKVIRPVTVDEWQEGITQTTGRVAINKNIKKSCQPAELEPGEDKTFSFSKRTQSKAGIDINEVNKINNNNLY
jgi:hypothetical protein